MQNNTVSSAEPLSAMVADGYSIEKILDGLENMLNDIRHVATQLPPAAYGVAQEGRSSIGAHMRHIIEFMQMLSDNSAGGVIDYENRERNPLYETDSHAMLVILAQLQAKLVSALTTYGAYHPLLLRETVIVGGGKLTVSTSLGRELLFMLQHGTHHLAIIHMQAAALGIDLGRSCGVAVATQSYREQAYG